MDINFRINKLPVATYNWLKVNSNQVNEEVEFSC